MTDSLGGETFSWPALLDAAAGPLRLEPPARRAYGRIAILHLVGTIWGEIALLRAAERFVRLHHVALDELMAPPPEGDHRVWFEGFLARLAAEEAFAPLPGDLMTPAAQGLVL